MHNRMAAGALDWTRVRRAARSGPARVDLRVVGLGHIGQRVAEVIAGAFGATVIAFSRRVRPADVPHGVALIDDIRAL